MKQFKSVLAMVLALVMLLSCVGTSFAAEEKKITNKTAISDLANKSDKTELKGFLSEEFEAKNTYKYADDETVRAIVMLEGAPEADVAEAGSEKAANHRIKLLNEHNTVRKAMKGINYKLQYEYTTLLNGFSCDVAYGDLKAIAAIDGVKAVYIANSYDAPILETPKADKQNNANILTGNDIMVGDYGIAGQGIVVAVLDTGLNTTHEAFQDSLGLSEAYGIMSEESIAAANTLAPGKYINAKIPFSYDYAEMDDDVTDYNGHGTHVSGTVGGYVGEATEDGGITFSFCGASPVAQIVSMKIFYDDRGGTTSDIYFYALEDAYRLGVDVVNMSIGAQNGFTYDASLETELFGNIYKRMADSGIILSVSAGNEYSMAYFSSQGYIDPSYTDYGTVATPSIYEGNVSVASVENMYYPASVIQIGESYFSFVDSTDEESADMNWVANFGGKTMDYVVLKDAEGKIDNGYPETYANFDVEGKIAIVTRGDITFEEKIENAYNAGAIGCVVVNHTANENIAMQIESFEIPAITMPFEALETILAADPQQMTIPDGLVEIENPNAALMSEFSNWGTSPMLTLDPTITSVGGMVYSSVIGSDDAYEVYSGTSMAAPNASGTYANVLAAIYAENPDMPKAEAAELAKTLLAGNGIIITDADGYPYSPRKQGAGLACADYAVENYISSSYITDPLKELGDDPEKTGVFEFSVTLKNNIYDDCYYTNFQALVLVDYIANFNTAENPIIGNTLTSDFADAEVSYKVNGEEVTEFTVPAGGETTVDVTITLTEEQKAFLDYYFENGTYVEGYVLFDEYYEGEWYSNTHATFLGYYGDWGKASALAYWDSFDLMEANYMVNNVPVNANGDTLADMGYGPYDLLASNGYLYTDVSLAYHFNNQTGEPVTYLGANPFDLAAEFMPEHIAISTPASNGTYVYADSFYLSPSLLRNARYIKMTVTNAETGEEYFVDNTPYIPKSVYDSEAGWQNYSMFMWDGKDANGEYVPSGTVATVNFDIMLPWGEADGVWQENVWSFDCTVDYTAPVLESVVYDEEAQTLTVTASDENYLASIYLCNAEYDILDQVNFSSEEKGASFTATFDVSDINAAYVTALDYATNEIEEWTRLYEVGVPATLNFHTPMGTTTVEAFTGDVYTFEEGAEPSESYDFMFWSPEEGTWTEDEVWYVSDPWWFGGDMWEITEGGEYNFYALYAEYERTPLEKANYWLDTRDDYSGEWAICGWDYTSSYDTENPMVLNEKGEGVRGTSFADFELGTQYIEFFTNQDGIRYTIESVGEGIYTVKNNLSGKYLATDAEFGIKMVDEADAFAQWKITAMSTTGTCMFNVGNEKAVFVYNDEESRFEVFDNTVPYYSSYLPSEWFQARFYVAQDTQDIVLCYTTEYCAHENVEIRDAKDATYTEEGYTGDVYCLDCGEMIAEGEVIPVLGATSGNCYFKSFTDCKDEWYHEAVDFVVANGLMNGVGGNRFAPNSTLTRAMVVTVLYRQAGSPAVAEKSTFTDVPADLWYADAVAWAQDMGIVNGVTADRFAPEKEVTREQIAAILWRYAGSPEVEGDMSAFKDADDISGYAKKAMSWAVSEGIFVGSDGKLTPLKNTTRAQFACIIMRYLDGSYDCAE